MPSHLVGIEGVRIHASTSLLWVPTAVLRLVSDGDWRSRRLKNYLKLKSSKIILVASAVSYFADQLTDDAIFFRRELNKWYT